MSPSPQPLPDSEVAARLAKLPSWRLETNQLARDLRFSAFLKAIDFVNRLAAVAEEMDHHPDITISWRRVQLRLTSHDAGGITPRDFALAGKIDSLLSEMSSVVR